MMNCPICNRPIECLDSVHAVIVGRYFDNTMPMTGIEVHDIISMEHWDCLNPRDLKDGEIK